MPGVTEVECGRQAHVLQPVLAGDALVLERVVEVARLEQGDELDARAAQDDVRSRTLVSRSSGT